MANATVSIRVDKQTYEALRKYCSSRGIKNCTRHINNLLKIGSTDYMHTIANLITEGEDVPETLIGAALLYCYTKKRTVNLYFDSNSPDPVEAALSVFDQRMQAKQRVVGEEDELLRELCGGSDTEWEGWDVTMGKKADRAAIALLYKYCAKVLDVAQDSITPTLIREALSNDLLDPAVLDGIIRDEYALYGVVEVQK